VRYFSPEEIESYEFLYSMPGYNRGEVRAFMQALAAQVRALQKKLNEVESNEARSEVAGLVAATEEATREVLNAAEASMKAAAADLRSELDAFRLQLADLTAEMRTRLDEVVANSRDAASTQPAPAAQPPTEVAESAAATKENNATESEPPTKDESDERSERAPVSTGSLVTSPGGEEQEIPPEWEELMREPEAEG
jgi:polyhydroxyalkanoate synthesis regulator phasin